MRKPLTILIIVSVLIIPYFAMASWWNPFSWHFKTKTQKIDTKQQINISNNIENKIKELPKQETSKGQVDSKTKSMIENRNSISNDESKKEQDYMIRLVSPNGGEKYTAGQRVDVKWTTKNIPSDAPIFITIKGFNEEVWISTSRNTGTDSITVPFIPFTPRFDPIPNTWTYGNYFTIGVATYNPKESSDKIKDYSDGYFSISKDINKIVEPEVVTKSMDSIIRNTDSTTAIINGTVRNSDSIPAKAWYQCSKSPEFKSGVVSGGDIVLVPKNSDPTDVKLNFFTIYGEDYYCRIVAQNSAGMGFGNSIKFTY